MAVANDRSMNAELALGAVDHTIRLRAGQDRGGIHHGENYYNHLVGGSNDYTGDFLVDDYLAGIVSRH